MRQRRYNVYRTMEYEKDVLKLIYEVKEEKSGVCIV